MSLIKNVGVIFKSSSKKAAARALKRAQKRNVVDVTTGSKITSDIKNGHKHATLTYKDATGATHTNKYIDGRNVSHSFAYELSTGSKTTHTIDHRTGINSAVSEYKGRITSESAAGKDIKNYNHTYSSTGTTVKRTDKTTNPEHGQVREFFDKTGKKTGMQVDKWAGTDDLMQVKKNQNGSRTILRAENSNAINKMDDTGNMEGIKSYYTTLPKNHYVKALQKKFANQNAAKGYAK